MNREHTKETFAEMLNGRQMGNEITRDEEAAAKALGFIVIFGYSDDNAEFRGVINDEVGCYNGGSFYLHRDGMLDVSGMEDCVRCRRRCIEEKKRCAEVEAVWCEDNQPDWIYKTKLPHATFDIMEGTEKFCRGIVIDTKDLPVL
jgi:hypothetical protein